MEQTVRIYGNYHKEETEKAMNKMIAEGWEIVRFTQSITAGSSLMISVLYQRKVKNPTNALDKVTAAGVD